MKILIVDDEPKILDIVEAYLEASSYQTFRAKSGSEALEVFHHVAPHLIVLDLMLPDINGIEVCRTIRKTSSVPIIMLTAKSSEGDILTGLQTGADDYIVKPFSPKELVARVEAVLRRVPPIIENPVLEFNQGKLIINPDTRQVLVDQADVYLTATEFDILLTLASREQQVFTREQLIEQTKGLEFDGYDRAIDSHIKNLRQKLGDSPKNPTYIVTVHGKGYRFGGRLHETNN